jgi:hypothetical protein
MEEAVRCKMYGGTQAVDIYWLLGRESRGEIVQSDAGGTMGGPMRPNYRYEGLLEPCAGERESGFVTTTGSYCMVDSSCNFCN